MEEEGSQSPTPHTPVAPTPETMSVIPSTSVVGGELTQIEPASQREELVVYGPHLPSRMCGAYRKKLAKRLRREAEGNQRSKEWLLNKVANLEFGGPKLKVGGVELIQRLHKATVWLPGPPEESAEVMSQLGTYNSTLNMSGWRSIGAPPLQNESGRQDTGDKYVLVFQLPESQDKILEALDNRPWMVPRQGRLQGDSPGSGRGGV